MFHFNMPNMPLFHLFTATQPKRAKMYKTSCLTSVLWQTLSPTDPHLKCRATYPSPCPCARKKINVSDKPTTCLFRSKRKTGFFFCSLYLQNCRWQFPVSAFTGWGVLSWQIQKIKETAQSLGCWRGPFCTQLLRCTTIKHCRSFKLSFMDILFMQMFWTPVTPVTPDTKTVCWTSLSECKVILRENTGLAEVRILGCNQSQRRRTGDNGDGDDNDENRPAVYKPAEIIR